MSKETGGYAFPIPDADLQTFQPKTIDEFKRIMSGMTLRDYFAAKAMAAIVRRYDGHSFGGGPNSPQYKDLADDAYFIADAMLKAREEV